MDSNTPSVESKEDGFTYQKRKLTREPGTLRFMGATITMHIMYVFRKIILVETG